MDDEIREAYIAILRGLSPETKLRTAMSLHRAAWEIKSAFLRKYSPELSEKEIHDRVLAAFAGDFQ